MKKLFSLLLVAVLIIAMATGAFASDASSYVSVSNDAPAVGDTITVNVGISNNPGFTSGKVSLSYDASVLEIVSMENVMFQGFANPATAQANHASVAPVTGDGTLCTATFRVIAAGDASVSATITDMYDGDDNAMSVPGSSASISVAEVEIHEHDYSVKGSDEDYHWMECECGEIDEDSKAEHEWVWVVDVEPTETEAGEGHWECACGDVKGVGTVIDPTGSTEEPEPTVKPTAKPTQAPSDPNKSPKTGDFTVFFCVASLLTITAAAVVIIIASKKNKQK